MKTKIIIRKGYHHIDTFDYLITMTKGDVVYFNDREYTVEFCCLDIDNKVMEIFIKE